MTKDFRLPTGGLIDRNRPLAFTLNGKALQGYAGDTLASALLAQGEMLLGRSFKYHRPRGIVGAGSEETNALLTLGAGASAVPNVRATMAALYGGLAAHTQNAWPSVHFDIGAVNDLLSPFLGAGFYYKTFMFGGPYMWRIFEFFIRRAAGLGQASHAVGSARFEKINAHCDILIAGGGAAGLAAALAAGRSGARVLIADEGLEPGGILKGNEGLGVEGISAEAWRQRTLAELASLPNVRLLPKTTVFGLYDGQVAGLLERFDHADPSALAERYWVVRAKKIILATGAIERPLLFAHNDRPGVMLAGALLSYAREWGTVPGFTPLIATNNDSAYATAIALQRAPGRQVTLVDCRPDVDAGLVMAAREAGAEVILGATLTQVQGGRKLRQAQIVNLTSGQTRKIACDLIGMSGGWSPSIHLAAHRGSKPVWSPAQGAFLAGDPAPGADWVVVGAAQGQASVGHTLKTAAKTGAAAARDLGFKAQALMPKVGGDAPLTSTPAPLDSPATYALPGKTFVDFQHDVTVKDIQQAAQEGFVSPEHMKRYTTLAMATDQGKLSNTLGQAILADAQGKSIADIGTTTYRPPFTPVSLGALAERNTPENWMPERMTPLKPWHMANGARLIESSNWRRPRFYPRGIENLMHASRREAAHVRTHVGLSDVSTLGKIEVQGPDAGRLLDLAYVNRLSTLKIGKSRYGVMLREDGVVLDDGTVSRLGADHYFLTTTTVEAPHVMAHLEFMVQVEFPDLDVHVTSVSDAWAAMALAGPKSRAVLETAVDRAHAANAAALGFMSFFEAQIAKTPVRIHRISFSGELAYEIYAPPRGAIDVWQAILAAGADHQIDVYGLEALDLLRIEKGFPTGNEIDGRTTLKMLGLEAMARDEKDFIGRTLRKRAAMVDPTVPTLVGLEPLVPDQPLQGGGQLVREADRLSTHDQLGYVSSAGYSTTHGRYLGLGFLRGGLESWQGKTLYVADPVRGQHFAVRVVHPVHVDPEGGRVRG